MNIKTTTPLLLAAALALPTAAGASSVGTAISGDGAKTLVFAAGAGEPNKLRVTKDGDALRVRDGGGKLHASAGCRNVDGRTARCPEAGVVALSIALGDGNNTALVNDDHPTEITASGTGTNTIRGGTGPDTITGGAGADDIDGRKGADEISGGGGYDVVRYTRATGVSVRLDGVANDGTPAGSWNLGEHDNVATDVEAVFGGDGDDTLIGNGYGNWLVGGAGQDVLRGLGGTDTIDAADGEADTVDCGAGVDQLTRDPGDAAAGCEAVVLG